jgi:PAS domain S-box-containing protein
VSVNAAFRELTGHDANKIVGRKVGDLQLWESDTELESARRDAKDDGSFRNREARLLHKDGTSIDCLVSTETISVPGKRRLLWLFQDITERRRSEAQLVDAIDAVMKDATWLSRSIVDKLATLRRPGPQAPIANLSTREREILALICDDLDDKMIAEQLDLSRNTVRNHVARIYAKIGVNRRSGAVVWGRERGMGSRLT